MGKCIAIGSGLKMARPGASIFRKRLDLLDAVDEPAVTGMLMDILSLWNRDDQTVEVTDPQKGTCDICEIKHTAERADEQFRHLVDSLHNTRRYRSRM